MRDGTTTAGRRYEPTDGASLALLLAERYPNEDWLAALAKGAVMSRGDVEGVLASVNPVPPEILEAASDIDAMLEPSDPAATENIFAALTNDRDAPMEVDSEAGLNALPAPKPHPSRSGSLHEQGERKEDRQNNEI